MAEPWTEKSLLAPLPRRAATYSSQTATVLREMVLSGQLRVGERINEVETAQALGISRAPLREAIQALVNEGLLVSIPNRGAFVRTFSEVELEDLYELRIAVELHALSLVASRAVGHELDELDHMLDETESRMGSDRSRHYPADLDLHVRLLELSRSPELLATGRSVHRRLALARSRSGYETERADHAFAQHRGVVAALRRGDSRAARDLLERHLRESLANALQILGQESRRSPSESRTRE